MDRLPLPLPLPLPLLLPKLVTPVTSDPVTTAGSGPANYPGQRLGVLPSQLPAWTTISIPIPLTPQPDDASFEQPCTSQATPSTTLKNIQCKATREGTTVCGIRFRHDSEKARKVVDPDGKPRYVHDGKVDVTRYRADRRNLHAGNYTPDGHNFPGRVTDPDGTIRGDAKQLKRYYLEEKAKAVLNPDGSLRFADAAGKADIRAYRQWRAENQARASQPAPTGECDLPAPEQAGDTAWMRAFSIDDS